MIVVTIDSVPGRNVERVCGLVKGASVRALSADEDLMAGMKNLVGGEVHEYTKVVAQAREQALDRCIANARSLGADAILGLRFFSSEVADGMAEVIAYGTAVKLGD